MQQPAEPLDTAELALRSRRLVQISSLTMAGLAIIAMRSVITEKWGDAAIMGA